MSINTDDNSAITSRLALEALRSGVPNRAAVRLLGCNQPQVEQRFTAMLDEVTDTDKSQGIAQGLLVSGDFGSGKSHLLVHLEHVALERNFICSKVTISKETTSLRPWQGVHVSDGERPPTRPQRSAHRRARAGVAT